MTSESDFEILKLIICSLNFKSAAISLLEFPEAKQLQSSFLIRNHINLLLAISENNQHKM
jgi:hypothetical protein